MNAYMIVPKAMLTYIAYFANELRIIWIYIVRKFITAFKEFESPFPDFKYECADLISVFLGKCLITRPKMVCYCHRNYVGLYISISHASISSIVDN